MTLSASERARGCFALAAVLFDINCLVKVIKNGDQNFTVNENFTHLVKNH